MQVSVPNNPLSLVAELNSALDTFGITAPENIAYFLGQCGAESGGLRYPLEIASGALYEYRSDLGNIHAGDGIKFACSGYIQVTGRSNYQAFSDYLSEIGKGDPNVMLLGKSYTCNRYPWAILAYWWYSNSMNSFCSKNPSINAVGAKVNGANPPNGAAERISYSNRAFKILVDM